MRPLLSPVTDLLGPVWNGNVAVLVIGFLLFTIWYRGSGSSNALGSRNFHSRAALYEDIWRQEESELWSWLEERVAVNGLPASSSSSISSKDAAKAEQKRLSNEKEKRKKALKGKDVLARLREEDLSLREMEEAIRVTQERLDVLRGVVEKKGARGQKVVSQTEKE